MKSKKFSPPTLRDVANYYQSSQWLYRLFCYHNHTLGMHYGFWQEGTTNRGQAITNENDAVISLGRITKDSRVLDAGCGVGGTAIHIAKKIGAHVVGITVDPNQQKQGTRYAKDAGVSHLVTIEVMDFSKMRFPDGFFDVVYGIESIGYAASKRAFLKEAYRVLVPGGRLVLCDGYTTRNPKTPEERKMLALIAWGWCLPPPMTSAAMTRAIRASGFIHVQKILKTEETWPSVKYFGMLARTAMPLANILFFVPSVHLQAVYKNAVALASVMRLFELGLGEYAIHIAEKPRDNTFIEEFSS